MTVDLEFGVDFRSKRFKRAADGLNFLASNLGRSLDASGPVVKRELREYLETISAALQKRHGNLYPGGTSEMSLSRRSGTLVRSIRESIAVKGTKLSNIVGEIGGVFYAKTHEHGAVIRAKRAKYLTIPLPAALNQDGTPKKRSAREWSNTFIQKSKKGNLLIFQKRGKSIVPLYVLKKEVKIPPRLNMKRTIDASISAFTDELAETLLREVVLGNV